MRPTLVLFVSFALAACGEATNNPTPDGGVDRPTADTPAADTPATDTPTTDTPTADQPAADVPMMRACGTERPALASTGNTEGLVIAADGTIYYSQSTGVGRIAADGTRNNSWVRITGASTVWGLALDRVRNRLYVGVPSAMKISVIDLSEGTPSATDFLTGAGQPNGLTMGPDGNLYYSDFGGGRVYRVDGDGMRSPVTTATISQANGLAFTSDGDLLVDSYGRGTITRLTLQDGAETARMVIAMGLGSPDGLALDEMGNMYVTDNAGGRVLRVPAGGGAAEELLSGLSAPANVEFGSGALSCNDIYVATRSGLRRIEDNSAAGARVPWH